MGLALYRRDRPRADRRSINQYLNLLRLEGNLTLVGAPPKPLALSSFALIFGNRSVSGSNIGGIRETQEMLDFCGKHNITADVEVIPIQKVTRTGSGSSRSISSTASRLTWRP